MTVVVPSGVNQPGAWNFADLHSSDAASVGFYVDVFGWEFADLGFATLIRCPGYGDHLAATVDPDIRERQSSDVTPPRFEDALKGRGLDPKSKRGAARAAPR